MMIAVAAAVVVVFLMPVCIAVLQQRPVHRATDAIEPVDGDLMPSAALASAPYAKWAHSHMVWLSSGHTQANELQLVSEYLAYHIPVGGIDIDSKWSTGVNNFIWDTTHFPNATLLIEQLHQLGVRVILWVTSVVDTDSSNHAVGQKNGYFLNDGFPLKWWHGWGSWIDCKCWNQQVVCLSNPDQIQTRKQSLGGIVKWTM
jgi:hypothetical protein